MEDDVKIIDDWTMELLGRLPECDLADDVRMEIWRLRYTFELDSLAGQPEHLHAKIRVAKYLSDAMVAGLA